MMTLQCLQDRRELAHTLLDHWNWDRDKSDWLNRFRISSNAVYPFAWQGRLHFLRFAPVQEKRDGQYEAELAWLAWLQTQGCEAVRPIPSRKGNWVEEISTEYGLMRACVFEGVEGERLDWMDWTDMPDAVPHAWGQALATLHETSSHWQPTPQTTPWSWKEVLDWSVRTVEQYPTLPPGALGQDENGLPWPAVRLEPGKIRREAERLHAVFSTLPTDASGYGLVHFDFEGDNLFWQEEQHRCVAIDFDDAMIHWHALDIILALENVAEIVTDSFSEEDGTATQPDTDEQDHDEQDTDEQVAIHHSPGIPDTDERVRGPQAANEATTRAERQCAQIQKMQALFLRGYRSVRAIPTETMRMAPDFQRFAGLYGYARILHGVAEVGALEPEWMTTLRGHLRELLGEREARLEGRNLSIFPAPGC